MSQIVQGVVSRVCNVWNTIVYASQIFSLLQAHEGEDSSTDILCRRLIENTTKSLQLGWIAADYYTKEDLDKLANAMKENYSVTTVSIGWSLRQKSLLNVLDAVIHMPNLRHLSLVLHTDLPEYFFLELEKCKTLQTLDIRNVRVRQSNPFVACGGPKWFASREMLFQDYNIVYALPYLKDISCIKLVDCDIQHEQVIQICHHVANRKRPLVVLSVAHNTSLGFTGILMLLGANILKLDLMGCEIAPPMARLMAKTISSKQLKDAPIEGLSLARNIHMGGRNGSFPLIEACGNRLKSLDLSNCNIPICTIFTILKSSNALKELILQGYDEFPGLEEFLLTNDCLTTLRLDNPDARCPVSRATFASALRGLSSNYTLKYLFMDWGDFGRYEFDYYLRLNRAGRNILRQENNIVTQDWTKVFGEATKNIDTLYWLICNSAAIFQHARPRKQRYSYHRLSRNTTT